MSSSVGSLDFLRAWWLNSKSERQSPEVEATSISKLGFITTVFYRLNSHRAQSQGEETQNLPHLSDGKSFKEFGGHILKLLQIGIIKRKWRAEVLEGKVSWGVS